MVSTRYAVTFVRSREEAMGWQLRVSRALRTLPVISPKSKAGQRAMAIFGIVVTAFLFWRVVLRGP
jgi:hypothetical protein